MMEQNLFELEVGTFNQKQLVGNMKKATKTKKFRSNVWKKVNEVEERLRLATERRDELSQWGIGNLVIQERIKCRAHERVIDLAQKVKLKPDPEMEKELAAMKKARRQIYRDIKEFVEERDKQPWRTWDHCLIVADSRKRSQKEMDEEIHAFDREINLLLG
jgi:hypothetical protein